MSDELIAGSVAIGIVPSMEGFTDKIRAEVVPSATSIGEDWGKAFGEAITGGNGDLMSKWGQSQAAQASETGSTTGQEYAEAFKARIEEILRELPEAEVGANTDEAQEALAKLREELEDLKANEIGVDMTNAEAMAKIDEIKTGLADLSDKPTIIPIEASITEAMDKVDELRAVAAKPILVPVELETAKGGASGAAGAGGAEADAAALGAGGLATGVESELSEAGEDSGEGFGTRFMGKIQGLIGAGSSNFGTLREGMTDKMGEAGEDAGKEFGGAFSGVLGAVTKIGVPAAIVGALVAVSAVFGEKLDMAQKQLQGTMATTGASWDQYTTKVTAAGKAGAVYGFTQDQVDTSLRSVLMVTGNMNEALASQKTIADIAASSHISLTAATQQYTRALVGNARAMKQLGVQQATGATPTAAFATAQTLLANRIAQAGSMANFAAQNHISLAKAQQLVSGATDGQTAAYDKLNAAGVTLTQLATQVTGAETGSATSIASLKNEHLSLAQAQALVSASTKGNIKDFNQLGIEVLPKSTTAAENFNQVQDILQAKMGGQAQAVADSFSGKISHIRAELEDVAENIGMKVLPGLESFMDWLVKLVPQVESLGDKIGKLVAPVVTIFFTGLGTILKVLTSGPMKDIVLAVGALTAAWFILDAAMDLNPFVALGIAVVFMIGLITKFHKQIIDEIMSIGHDIEHYWDDTWDTVRNFFEGIWNAIYGFMKKYGQDFLVLFGPAGFIAAVVINIIKYHQQIERFIEDTWNDILRFLKSIGADIAKYWNDLWADVYNYLHGEWVMIDNVIHDALDWIKGTINDALNWIHGQWNVFWSGIYNLANTTWSKLKTGFGTFFSWLKTAWQDAVNAVKTIWDTVQGIAQKPVDFIVGTIYNKGIVPVVNDIAGVFGMHPLHPVSGFASGTQGAPPGWAWVGERGPELVRMTGGEQVLTTEQSMATGLWGQGTGYSEGTGGGLSVVPGSPFGGGGGQLQQINPHPTGDQSALTTFGTDPLGSLIHGLRDLAGDALAAGLNHILNPMINDIPSMDTKWGQFLKKDILSFEQQLVNYIKGISEGPGGTGSGASIIADAEKYVGHRYVFGGPSNPQGGWDCSSFVSYVLGHDMKMSIPGGSWATVTSNGAGHGPVASDYGAWSGAKNKADQNAQHANPGDLLTWNTHVGFARAANQMISAYDTASGTINTPIIGAGPSGEQLVIRTINAVSSIMASKMAPSGTQIGAEEEYAASLFGRYGWGPGQLSPLISLWNKESGWNANAVNASSGAYGIPQALGQGHPYNLGDYQAQIAWGLGYISGRYGSPAGAWAHEEEFNWYATGTGKSGARPGWAWVGEDGPELVKFGGGEEVMSAAQSLAAIGGGPSTGYAGGTLTASRSGDLAMSGASSMKEALRAVESKLDAVVKATRNVGGDVASNLNSTGRGAGARAVYNTRGR
jgi:hypothetical protein